jgi:hypothetical protein
MADCPRAGKLFGGCKFSPRYDRSPLTQDQLLGLASATAPVFTSDIEACAGRTYVRDVCERCGKTIERGRPA